MHTFPTAEVDSYLRHIEEAAESQAEQLRLLAVEAARRRSPNVGPRMNTPTTKAHPPQTSACEHPHLAMDTASELNVAHIV
ncbi:hypothetical protein A0H81_07191 [Grifola frondosa]|uniref:Uncharacterized protein n=1 Tax=Grifola frondosa TaxID=5627 RepID=A0A1C7MA79_GRIFR|nr:hypothetical protein A0H81_07191 [Grifola frondosa]